MKPALAEPGNETVRSGVGDNKYIKKSNVTTKRKGFLRRHWFLIFSIFLVAAICTLCILMVTFNSSYIVVMLRFSEITQGNNPDGSPFDIYELLSEDVLSAACEKVDNRIDPVTLKKHITLSSNSAIGSFNSIQEKVMDGNNDYYYFPNRYTITYSVISNRIKDSGINACIEAIRESFALPGKREILEALAEAYSEQYEKLHIIKADFFDVVWSDVEQLDHFNRVSELQRIVEKMSRYVSGRYDEHVQYVSKDGISFGDLNTQLSSILNVDIEAYKSYVIEQGITSDKEKLLKQLKYVANDNKDIYRRKMAEYNVMLEGIDIYDPNITKVTFVPSLDINDEFYMSRTKIGIDYLTRKANAAKIEAEEALNTAQYYEYLATQFSNSHMPNSSEFYTADEMSKGIINKINDFSEKAITVNEEYINDVTYERILATGVENGKDLMYIIVLVGKTAVFSFAALYSLYCIAVFFRKFLCCLKNSGKKVNDAYDNPEFL